MNSRLFTHLRVDVKRQAKVPGTPLNRRTSAGWPKFGVVQMAPATPTGHLALTRLIWLPWDR